MKDIPSLFGSMVFDNSIMQKKLPANTYNAIQKTIKSGVPLDIAEANIIANAMKDWAIDKGVTHFTHWFQPMTGITAEKHESFINPTDDGKAIMDFSGKELIKGEPDASSFPSGGIRATFEARGYTAWDPTSFAFIKEGVLCIPTAFCAYSGEVLDKKTPLLRSIEALNKQALRILKLFGKTKVKRVTPFVGPEQEYFLVNKELYEKRKDLTYCGRTLFGAKPPKGQELDDHYYGVLKKRVSDYMKELDIELWKMGVFSKTKHNEVAPSQHELCPIFSTVNIATDHNQIIMETMKSVAAKHGLACLLHEKPFAGINGSGKHNNWSISTDTGVNLFNPGNSPYENAQFLLFLTAVIKAVDEHQDLLRASIASAGNDHRLGANEAPPAIISIFLGEELSDIVFSLIKGKNYSKKTVPDIEIGVDTLPKIPKDNTDRNRTSPFAFTGNKFEFRMLGSSASIAEPNIILNGILADALESFANELEKAEDFKSSLKNVIISTLQKHQRIIFNGNNYSDDWVKEAEKRGLLNLQSTVEALPCLIKEKNIALFSKHNIYNKKELMSRYEIYIEKYNKTINIEALTVIDMAKRNIMPAVEKYISSIAKTAYYKKQTFDNISCEYENIVIEKLSELLLNLYKKTEELESKTADLKDFKNELEKAKYSKNVIVVLMEEIRNIADKLETMVNAKYWPFPTYGDLLFSV